jgi:hypothetical protein
MQSSRFFLIAGVAAASEKLGWEGKFVPPRVVEGMISFVVISLLSHDENE